MDDAKRDVYRQTCHEMARVRPVVVPDDVGDWTEHWAEQLRRVDDGSIWRDEVDGQQDPLLSVAVAYLGEKVDQSQRLIRQLVLEGAPKALIDAACEAAKEFEEARGRLDERYALTHLHRARQHRNPEWAVVVERHDARMAALDA